MTFTFITVARRAALQESHVLRAFARYGRPPYTPWVPIDYQDEWERAKRTTLRDRGMV